MRYADVTKHDKHMAAQRSALESLLAQDELRHITPLKMLGLYREHIRVVAVDVGTEQAFLMLSPRAASQYDSAKYPSASLVVFPVLPVSPSAAMIEACVFSILENAGAETFVVKSCVLELIATLRLALPTVNCQRALLTLTPGDEDDAAFINPAYVTAVVQVASHIPPDAFALLAAHDVYSASELETMFAEGSGRCLLSIHNNEAVAIALSFPNTPTLHEIGSLYVAPHARRSGHASALLRAALADMAARNLAVRYVVDATNAPSIELATRCGLRQVMRLEHWLSA